MMRLATAHVSSARPILKRLQKPHSGIVPDCGHIEHVSQFNLHLGSQRMQAAGAMHAHSRAKHKAATLKPVPKNYGLMQRW
jgi:hypothetical protein